MRGRWSTHRTHGAQATHRNDTRLSELFRVTGLGRTVSRRPTRDVVTASTVALTGPSGILQPDTPLLPVPLTGNAYRVCHGGEGSRP